MNSLFQKMFKVHLPISNERSMHMQIRMRMRWFVLVLCAIAVAGNGIAAPAKKMPAKAGPAGGKQEAAQVSPESQHRSAWFREAKFGLFIHWGLYAVPAGEWKGKPVAGIGEWIMNRAKIPVKEYEQLAGRFNPVKFNADEWAQLAQDAGMKYLTITSKHHDGFAMYRSKASKYNIVDATPFGRDPMKELAEACARRGIKLCFYYSQAQDWHEPGGMGNSWDFGDDKTKSTDGRYDQYLESKAIPQVREILTQYGPIGLIWFDTPKEMTPERAGKFTQLVRELQPACLVNGRLGGTGDYQSMRDNQIPTMVVKGAWETPATLNDTWGYKKDDHNWKTPEMIVFKLVDIASKGGNYLLNVGPTAEGIIPAESVKVLREVGAWMKVNGEAIYGTGPTPFGQEFGEEKGATDEYGRKVKVSGGRAWRCTTKSGKIFIHFFQWPAGEFVLPATGAKVNKAYLLADPERKPLGLSRDNGRVSVKLTAENPGRIATVLCIETEK